MCLKCGSIFNNHAIANLLLNANERMLKKALNCCWGKPTVLCLSLCI